MPQIRTGKSWERAEKPLTERGFGLPRSLLSLYTNSFDFPQYSPDVLPGGELWVLLVVILFF